MLHVELEMIYNNIKKYLKNKEFCTKNKEFCTNCFKRYYTYEGECLNCNLTGVNTCTWNFSFKKVVATSYISEYKGTSS